MNRKWALKKRLASVDYEPTTPDTDPNKDPEHLSWIRTLPCAVAAHSCIGDKSCFGTNHAHHPTGSGLALKAPDWMALPLCHEHHSQLHSVRGYFFGWTKPRLKSWQSAMAMLYRKLGELRKENE